MENEDDDYEPVDVESEMHIAWYSMSDYAQLAKIKKNCLKLLVNLLRTPVYLANDTHAQVVFNVFYPKATDEVVEEIIYLGRLFIFMLALLFDDHVAQDKNERIEFKYTPHKRRLLGQNVISECNSERTACALIVLHSARDAEHQKCYTYIGGGLPNDPPHCYAIVNKHMPLTVADRLMALLQFVGDAKRPQIIRRQNKSIHNMLDEEHRENFSGNRATAIAKHVDALKSKFKTKEALLQYAIEQKR